MLTIPSSCEVATCPTAATEGYANRGDLPYDYEDLGLSKDQILEKFAAKGEHEFHKRSGWEKAKTAGLTQLNDYWDWVVGQIALDDEAY